MPNAAIFNILNDFFLGKNVVFTKKLDELQDPILISHILEGVNLSFG
jgi:hypothetical protein